MYRFSAPATVLAAVLLAACGGGGSSGSAPALPVPMPSASAPVVPASGALATQTLNGAPGYVNAANRTVYVFDSDLAVLGTSTCSGACSVVWPSVVPVSGTTYGAPWSVIVRSDSTQQLAYNKHPLYTYAGDTAAGQTNGDGITSFGAAWHIARPQGTAGGVTPPTGSTPPPGY